MLLDYMRKKMHFLTKRASDMESELIVACTQTKNIYPKMSITPNYVNGRRVCERACVSVYIIQTTSNTTGHAAQ